MITSKIIRTPFPLIACNGCYDKVQWSAGAGLLAAPVLDQRQTVRKGYVRFICLFVLSPGLFVFLKEKYLKSALPRRKFLVCAVFNSIRCFNQPYEFNPGKWFLGKRSKNQGRSPVSLIHVMAFYDWVTERAAGCLFRRPFYCRA